MGERGPRKRPRQVDERYQGFGSRLRRCREQAGMHQAELARRAEVSQAAIAQYETSTRLPSLPQAADLAAALRVTVDELLGGTGGPSVVHYHAPGEVRVDVTNPGLVVFGGFGPEDIERLLETWQALREGLQGAPPPGAADASGAA